MLGQKDHNLHFHAVAVHDKTVFLETAPLSSRRASIANPYHQRPEVVWDLRGLKAYPHYKAVSIRIGSDLDQTDSSRIEHVRTRTRSSRIEPVAGVDHVM